LVNGDTALNFIHPADADYQERAAAKLSKKYIEIDYADVYNDATGAVLMQYNRKNQPLDNGTTLTTNPYIYFYPSLMKHNSSNYYVNNASSNRYGNLNATFMMRMAEVYLIAAEADVYVNGGGNAL